MKPIVLTPGMGVGPEVTARALALQPSWRPILLAGRANVVRPALEAEGLAADSIPDLHTPPQAPLSLFDPGDQPGEPTEVAAVRLGAQACLQNHAAALVTGPIHKARLVAGGFKHRGHT
ncbi:MAG: hypothetical protein CL927_03930, partial [Deltaproteobacteria bacterium]|nr:hypothetical protein [Deltaproteobacteria bacterium]